MADRHAKRTPQQKKRISLGHQGMVGLRTNHDSGSNNLSLTVPADLTRVLHDKLGDEIDNIFFKVELVEEGILFRVVDPEDIPRPAWTLKPKEDNNEKN